MWEVNRAARRGEYVTTVRPAAATAPRPRGVPHGVGTVAAEGFDDPVALVAERDDVDAAFGDAGDRGVHTDVLRGGRLNHSSNRVAASADRCDRGDAGAAPERSVPVTSREVTYHENR